MFWRKRTDPSQAIQPVSTKIEAVPVVFQEKGVTRTSGEPGAPEDLETVIESLGSVLRLLGKHSFDVGEQRAETISQLFEKWATHVLVLGPKPDDPPGAKGATDRDYAAMLRFLGKHRREEAEYVTNSLTGMRDAIWVFLQTLNRAIVDDTSSDRKIRERITRLQGAVTSNSLEELKKEAAATASVLGDMLEQRQKRHRSEANELFTRLKALREELQEAQKEGETDPLTRLHNRKSLDSAIGRTAAYAGVTRRGAGLLMVDIDHFKAINDKHGHPGGDTVLREVADCLVRTFPRRSDIVARYGGEEFAVILQDTDIRDAQQLAEKLLAAIRGLSIRVGSTDVKITVSVGFSEIATGETGDGWVSRTDRALYDAKHAGRNRAMEAAPSDLVRPGQLLSTKPGGAVHPSGRPSGRPVK